MKDWFYFPSWTNSAFEKRIIIRRKIWKSQKDLDANCAHADDWTFDNVFLFVGNMATTIGYGHIVPESQHGKLMCIICRFTSPGPDSRPLIF